MVQQGFAQPAQEGRGLAVAAAVVVKCPAGAPGQLPATQHTQSCHRTPQQAAGALHVRHGAREANASDDGVGGGEVQGKGLHAREAACHSDTPTCRLPVTAQADNMAAARSNFGRYPPRAASNGVLASVSRRKPLVKVE